MRKISTIWYVVDHAEGQLSWSAKKDAAESFRSFKAAQKRAVELSQSEPNKQFMIAQVTHVCAAAVGPSVTGRVGM